MINQIVTKWQYRFGLIGKRLDYSFSPDYFHGIFERAGLLATHSYAAWPLDENEVADFLAKKAFDGCNVTIPYKMRAADYCDALIGFAAETGAVNTIKRVGTDLIGYNTDVYGVLQTLNKAFPSKGKLSADPIPPKVLILGTGGASQAVAAACDYLQWDYTFVSRTVTQDYETYESIKSKFHLSAFQVIINTTPVGMADDTNSIPDLAIDQLSENHFIFDVIYTPKKTLLLKRAEEAGARIMNGEIMLHEQANLAWRIWNLSH
jgi:shikimate dehydrogenase